MLSAYSWFCAQGLVLWGPYLVQLLYLSTLPTWQRTNFLMGLGKTGNCGFGSIRIIMHPWVKQGGREG